MKILIVVDLILMENQSDGGFIEELGSYADDVEVIRQVQSRRYEIYIIQMI